MVQYYWNPNMQQQMRPPNMQQPMQQPNFQNPNNLQFVPPPQPMTPSGRPILPTGETSYIENILRLNIGEPGIFHFSFTHTLEETLNVRNVAGAVVEAGRDHVIIKEESTDRNFLFPMIYFDYAEFLGEINYFPQTNQSRQI